MNHYESTQKILPFMTPFPAAADVFSGDLVRHQRHFQPLLSIDLSALNPDWSGKIHFVTPKEPVEGLVGQTTKEHHDYYNRENWVAFRLENDRYTFMGDFRYFALENGPDAEIEQHYRETDESLAKTQAFYREHGILNSWSQTDNPCEWFDELGGEPWAGNWADMGDFPLAVTDGDKAHPLTEDGRPFLYIGWLAGYSYRDGGADGILLFYDPVEKIALLTFDWT